MSETKPYFAMAACILFIIPLDMLAARLHSYTLGEAGNFLLGMWCCSLLRDFRHSEEATVDKLQKAGNGSCVRGTCTHPEHVFARTGKWPPKQEDAK